MAFNASILGLATIRLGSKGDVVAAWQRFLISKKYQVGVADGSFGKATDLATKDYQTKNQLTSDGIIGARSFQLALKQGFIYFVPNLTMTLLLQGLNFGLNELKDIQAVLNTVLVVKPEPKYPTRPPLKVDGKFGVGSTLATIEVYRQLDTTKFRELLGQKLSPRTKTTLGDDFNIALDIFSEYTRRLRVRLSGPEWVAQFPGSTSLDDLSFPFREYAQEFFTALKEAKAIVEIAATYRPPERAYMMHYGVRVAKGEVFAGDVPDFPGVEIDWEHYTNAISVWWADKMCEKYDIAFPAALRSNHTVGRAVDWFIGWEGTLKIKDVAGKVVEIGAPNNSFDNADLWDVAATYGVYKLPADPPHWSLDGF
jgi:peptidoglycan hydrolase-like protein with peptidoglycan-binding domain